jgi:hypothetical protein
MTEKDVGVVGEAYEDQRCDKARHDEALPATHHPRPADFWRYSICTKDEEFLENKRDCQGQGEGPADDTSDRE